MTDRLRNGSETELIIPYKIMEGVLLYYLGVGGWGAGAIKLPPS